MKLLELFRASEATSLTLRLATALELAVLSIRAGSAVPASAGNKTTVASMSKRTVQFIPKERDTTSAQDITRMAATPLRLQ